MLSSLVSSFKLPTSTFARFLSVQDTPFTVTPKAFAKLSNMVKDDSFLRIKVEEGGCAGLKYSFDIEEPSLRQTDDRVIKDNDYPEVRIDPFSLAYLQDARLEFIQEDFREFFKVTNPHATATCSCGESYSV